MRSRTPPGSDDLLFGLRLADRLRRQPLQFAVEIRRRYGDLASFRLGPYRVCVVNHPAYVREVLVTQASNFCRLPRVMRVLSQVDGNGLVISEGSFWLRQRRRLQPAFHVDCLDRYASITVTLTGRMLDRWIGVEEVEVARAMAELVLEVLTQTLFGVELTTGEVDGVCDAVTVLSELLVQEMGLPFPLPDWFPSPGKRRKRMAIHVLDVFCRKLFESRRCAGEHQRDLLTALLSPGREGEASHQQAERQARDEAMTLLHAGQETTATGLAWAWYRVAKHPDVQARLVREIDTVLGGRTPRFSDVPLLPYTGMVIQEVLRLHVPTWILFPRQAVREVRIGGYRLPRGSWVFIFPFALHRDPRWFAEPERFAPERFAPGRAEQIPPCAYLPFGAGPHVCLGQRLARTVMTLIVATVLQRFRLTLAAGQGVPEPEPFLALRPKGGIRIALARPSHYPFHRPR